MDVQLSISVLVSDRTDTADKCLGSLVPLLREISSELIVVYTGTNPVSLEIAKKYTDHIVPFEWCDDFSAARNAGLEEAVGDWFLYLDDDEWFEDCGEIIEFFKSGEYRDYHSGRYIVRNYFDWNGIGFADTAVGRIVRREKGLRFVGIVHEALVPWTGPEKFFKCFAHHYGYVKEDKNRRMSGTERNIPLLKRQIEAEPGEIRYRAQLVQEYNVTGEHGKAEEECRTILEIGGERWSDGYVHWTAVHLVRSLLDQNRWQEAFDEGKRILDSGRLCGLFTLNLYIRLMKSCVVLRKYDEGILFALNFILLRNQMEEQPADWDQQQILELNRGSTVKNSFHLFSDALICSASVEDFRSMEVFLAEILLTDGSEESVVYQCLDEFKERYWSCERQILTAFDGIESDHPYVMLQRALLREKMGRIDEAKLVYQKCRPERNCSYAYQLVLMAVRNSFTLPDFLGIMDLEEWRRCAQQIAEKYKWSHYRNDREKIDTLFSELPLLKAVLIQKITAGLIYSNELNGDEFFEILSEFCGNVLELNHFLYRDELFTEELSFCLPKECRAALRIQTVLAGLDTGRVFQSLRELKELVVCYPELAYIVRRLTDSIEKGYFGRADRNACEEYYETGQKVKTAIRILEKDGRYVEALEIADQLSGLLPDDPEVQRFRQRLRQLVSRNE